jgi:predicted SAM-dependent methyltransferase
VVVDLGCGPNKVPGALGIDMRAVVGVNAVCDVEQALPLRTNSVDVVCYDM